MKLVGPFTQILPLSHLSLTGPLRDEALTVIKDGGVLCDGEKIIAIGRYCDLKKDFSGEREEISGDSVLLPGFIDAHTHLLFVGVRAHDYAQRLSGKSYLEIAADGGGILDTVKKTRAAGDGELLNLLRKRCERVLRHGITTCEVKSGYGLSVSEELRHLRVIDTAKKVPGLDILPTCLAAHILPPEYRDPRAYLHDVVTQLLPQVKADGLATRVDIFVEEGAFSVPEARDFLKTAHSLGFSLTLHADQFSAGGAELACELHAVSADHLEVCPPEVMKRLAATHVVATVLPGSSLGLGLPFAPARQLLDHGCTLAIASDFNPGSAPMGDLLTQAAILSAREKLTTAETLTALTGRAALALGLFDRGVLKAGKLADMQTFPCADYREILYNQGQLRPNRVWKRGIFHE